MIRFGDTVRDKITGIEGIVTGRCEYITGCNQYLVQPKAQNKVEKPKNYWFDEDRLELKRKKRLSLTRNINGFDSEDPKK